MLSIRPSDPRRHVFFMFFHLQDDPQCFCPRKCLITIDKPRIQWCTNIPQPIARRDRNYGPSYVAEPYRYAPYLIYSTVSTTVQIVDFDGPQSPSPPTYFHLCNLVTLLRLCLLHRRTTRHPEENLHQMDKCPIVQGMYDDIDDQQNVITYHNLGILTWNIVILSPFRPMPLWWWNYSRIYAMEPPW